MRRACRAHLTEWEDDDVNDDLLRRRLVEAGLDHDAIETIVEEVAEQPDADDTDDDAYDPDWDDEVEVYDDHGTPRLLITLAPPAPLGFFGQAMKAISKIVPPTAVIKTTERGYEVWSRPATEEQMSRGRAGL